MNKLLEEIVITGLGTVFKHTEDGFNWLVSEITKSLERQEIIVDLASDDPFPVYSINMPVGGRESLLEWLESGCTAEADHHVWINTRGPFVFRSSTERRGFALILRLAIQQRSK